MKTVLITGAGGAIGTALAVGFAQSGCALALNFNKSREKTENLARVLSDSYRIAAFALQADVSDPEQVRSMVSRVEDEFGHIDVLVNNAGIARQSLFTEITDTEWQTMRGVNLDGVFYTSRETLKNMLPRHRGVIINISSVWGQTGASCEVHYSAAKAGVIGLTKALAKEVAPSGIRVNCIAPGAVSSEMLSGFNEEEIQAICDETPLGRLGSPKEISDAAVFLASERAAFITGQILGVNGGMYI